MSPRSVSRVIPGSRRSVISISAGGCVRSSSLSRYVATMAKEAMRADRMTCRSSSNVGLSAQCRSSNKRSIGRSREATASIPATASNRRYRCPSGSISSGLGRSGMRLRSSGTNGASSPPAPMAANWPRSSTSGQWRKYQLRHSTKGWYGTRFSSSLYPMRTVVPSAARLRANSSESRVFPMPGSPATSTN